MPELLTDREAEITITAVNENFLPLYATEGAAGADVRACITEPVTIEPGKLGKISTGLRVAIPHGFEIQVRPRSGLAAKNQISVLNSPGTIDSDYRGEVCVLLINHGDQPFVVEPGMRIAQFVVAPVTRGYFIPRATLPETTRGEGGFGHTGTT